MNKVATYKSTVSAIAVLMLGLWVGTAFAAHPLVSEDTGTQGPGGNQIELNSDWSKDAGKTTGTAAFTYTRGLTETVDVFMNVPNTWKSPAGESTGMGDTSLGAKWRVFENDGFSLGVKPEWRFATGDENKGLGNGKDSYAMTLMGQIEAGDFTFLLNYGTTRNRFQLQSDQDDKRKTVNRFSVAMLYGLTDRMTVFVDTGRSDAADKVDATKPKFMLLGAIYSLTDDLDLDIGYKKGLNDSEIDTQWGVGATWRFK